MRTFESPEDLPGRSPVAWRRSPVAIGLAVLAGVAWPPLWLTLIFWQPSTGLPIRHVVGMVD